MRILHLVEAFGGGVFTMLTRLCNGQAARGHEVHLAFARREETPEDVAAHLDPSVDLHELALVRPIRWREDLAGLVTIRALLRTLHPDVLHLHSSKAGVLGRIAAATSPGRFATFYTPHGLSFLQEDYSPRARALFRRIEWCMARLGGTVVACSASEQAIVRQRITPRRVALVENAVDVDAIPPWQRRDDGAVRIGIAGRITYARNSELFGRLAREHSAANVRFRWIGGGDDADRKRLQACGVEVTGWMSQREALREMSTLDIYLHPSRWEGMPVALIEAQVAGLPAVATDVVGNRDVVVDGETGFVVRDEDAMSQALGRLISDGGLRRRLGERARALALQRFNLARMVDGHLRLYAAAAGGGSRATEDFA